MKRKIPLLLLCFLFLGMTAYFGSRLYLEWGEYRAGEQVYEELLRHVQPETLPAGEPAEETHAIQDKQPTAPAPMPLPRDTDFPVVDFDALLEINPDVVAWICIEGTNINYPVVQSGDNSYYLHRLVNGTHNSAGSIFLDYRSEGDLSDRHSVIYGHHMKNGTMFQEITKYKEQSFYDAHPVCLIMTPEKNYTLELFAAYVTDLNSQAWKLEFASDEEYGQWLADAVSKSTFTSTVEPTAQDRVVTLSTCTYEYNDARFVIAGILKPQSIQ